MTLPDHAITSLAALVAACFARYVLQLPADALAPPRGRVNTHGWQIDYLFADDADGPHVDVYACHRMTNDQHLRFRPGRPVEPLPALQDARPSSPDPVEDARLQAEYFSANQRVSALLAAKGFGPGGQGG